MPGIVGIINSKKVNKDLISKMCQSIKHEDWYKIDAYTANTCAISRIHLGIFNPEPQPIFNKDKSICIFMDGKIYDYEKEMKELQCKGYKFDIGSDPKFCLHLYEELGPNFAKRLNGSFVIIVYDIKHKKLIIVNDRHGLRPLYYKINNNQLLFASEIKAILEDTAFKKELNDKAVANFFAFREILGNKTFFKNIVVLPPASILTYKDGKISIKHYWNFKYAEDYSVSEEEFVYQLVETFKKAVRIRMKDNFRYGVALSGGLDSRSIIGAIDEQQRNKITAFTFGEQGCHEAIVARRVADKAKVKWRFIEINPNILIPYTERVVYFTDGMDTIAVSFLPYVYDIARQHVDVLFDGLALDLLLGGSYLNARTLNESNEELTNILFRERTRPCFSLSMMARLFTYDYYKKIKGMPINSLKESLKSAKGIHPANKADYFYLQDHVRRLVFMGDVLMRDKIEEAIPSYDNDFVNLILRIPPNLRIGHRIYRKFLLKLSPELAKIPYQKTMVHADAQLVLWKLGRIYHGVKRRVKKQVFRISKGKIFLPDRHETTNFGDWIKFDNEWKRFIKRTLLNLPGEYFNKKYIRTIIKEHGEGTTDHSLRIALLATFGLFLKLFGDSRT